MGLSCGKRDGRKTRSVPPWIGTSTRLKSSAADFAPGRACISSSVASSRGSSRLSQDFQSLMPMLALALPAVRCE